MWYSYDKVLSYNAMLNFILGERGVGKSYGIKKYCVNRFKKKKRKFIYLRRYHTEIEKVLKDNKFFDDIKNDETLKNDSLYISGSKFYCNKEVCGYAISLSKALIEKSVPYNDVDIIIFDEFLTDGTTYRYIKDEPEKLLDFIETVGRLRDIKCFCLGNSISQVNPYFDYFNISLPYNSDIKTFKNGLILINYIKNENYRKIKHESKFGKLIEGTHYSEYAIDNTFLQDNNNFIKKKDPKSKFFYTICLNNKYYGIWLDYNSNKMYVSKKYILNNIVITFDLNSHTENTILLKSRSVFFQNLLNHYRNGGLFFENQNIKSDMINLIRKTHN